MFYDVSYDNVSPDNALHTLIFRRKCTDSSTAIKAKSLNALAAQTNSTYQIVNNLSDLYYYISDPKRNIDLIGIEIEELYSNSGPDAWSLLYAINVIMDVADSSAVIVAGASLTSNPKHIKDFLSLSHRCIGIFPDGPEFSDDEKLKAVLAFKAKKLYVPEQIKKLINPKKAKDNQENKLTIRQQQILGLIISRGASNKMIARSLNIAESTVKLHVTGLLKKFNAKNRTQLAVSINNKV